MLDEIRKRLNAANLFNLWKTSSPNNRKVILGPIQKNCSGEQEKIGK